MAESRTPPPTSHGQVFVLDEPTSGLHLGPGAGHDGGQVVFEGTPADLVAAASTLTGKHLATYVSG